MNTYKKTFGAAGEDLTAQYLQKNGYSIVARNYTKKYGEIDLIAQKGEVLAFIEVKTRAREYENITGIITISKQKKMIKVAKAYMGQHNVIDKVCRFDVAFIQTVNGVQKISYIPNAFCQN